MFSATIPSEITTLASSILRNPVFVNTTPASPAVELIDQCVYFVDKGNKGNLLKELLKDPTITSALVFSRTKHGADKICKLLNAAKISASAIHGNKSQSARQRVLDSFKKGHTRVLVATDIAARGIDVDRLSHVINFELPNEPETYVHRIGRTGRAGLGGKAVSFCNFDEKAYLKDIETLIKKQIPVAADNPFPMQIFQASEPKTPARTRPSSREAAPAEKARRRHNRRGSAKNKLNES